MINLVNTLRERGEEGLNFYSTSSPANGRRNIKFKILHFLRIFF